MSLGWLHVDDLEWSSFQPNLCFRLCYCNLFLP